MDDVIFDLFGHPVHRRREGRGRPEHVWSEEFSHKISLLLAIGHDIAKVAEILGISQPTLRKHYFSELQAKRTARERLMAKQLYRLNKSAEAGNVAAEKALFGMVEREQMRRLGDTLSGPARNKEAKAPQLGKKAQADAEAMGISGKYAPPIPGMNILN